MFKKKNSLHTPLEAACHDESLCPQRQLFSCPVSCIDRSVSLPAKLKYHQMLDSRRRLGCTHICQSSLKKRGQQPPVIKAPKL